MSVIFSFCAIFRRLTPVHDVYAIFTATDCPAVITNLYPDIEDCWIVSFENESAAVETALWLQSQTFNGVPIHCRVKSAVTPKAAQYYAPATPYAQPYVNPQLTYPYNGNVPMGVYGNGYMANGYGMPQYQYPQQTMQPMPSVLAPITNTSPTHSPVNGHNHGRNNKLHNRSTTAITTSMLNTTTTSCRITTLSRRQRTCKTTHKTSIISNITASIITTNNNQHNNQRNSSSSRRHNNNNSSI